MNYNNYIGGRRMPSHGPAIVPPMEEILGLPEPIIDPLYDLGSLFGIKGTWHRLRALVAFNWCFQGTGESETEDFVCEVRREFEELLGRVMTELEWAEFNVRAKVHAENVMRPIFERRLPHGL